MAKKTNLIPTKIVLDTATKGYDVAISYDVYDMEDNLLNKYSRQSLNCTKIKNAEINETVEKLYELIENYLNK